MRGNIKIARVQGIPIYVNVTWFLTLAFVTSVLALQVYPETFPLGSDLRDNYLVHWLMALGSGLVFFGSVLLHELAHSLVAKKNGIPVKGITLFIFGGVAQITQDARRPRTEFIMAIVGPLTSLLLCAIFLGLWWLVGDFAEDKPLPAVLEWLGLMNFVVGVFNLVPGFPMDGGRVLRSALWGITGSFRKATRWAAWSGRAVGFGLIGLGGVIALGFFSFTHPWNGVWLAVVGFFLDSAARQSWFQVQALDALARYKAEEIMAEELSTAGSEERLADVLARIQPGRRFTFFVKKDEQVVGVLTEKEVAKLTPIERDRATVEEVMLPRDEVAIAGPSDDGATLLQNMDAADVWALPVVSKGQVIGVVSRENLIRIVAARALGPRQRPEPT